MSAGETVEKQACGASMSEATFTLHTKRDLDHSFSTTVLPEKNVWNLIFPDQIRATFVSYVSDILKSDLGLGSTTT